ncbi:zinc ribbon domain-containing protein [Pseudomonas sp. HS6]|uniref:zinc ribbon domain-containing protein n=1 Tax=Pseudomonas sp. HS6 TaxID=2850559 RepID=UPI0020187952|nr:zinc ribbon domain-containing protein [Pseudomonas sp. HS6]UQS12888.1 hypothetical protein JJN09_16790 [Pseudomonas sp. HS6]
MALIECYECKRSISPEAKTCIHCGAPMTGAQVPAKANSVASTISFGSLPRNKAVAEAFVAESASTAAPAPKVTPAAAGRRRRQQAEQAVAPELNADGSRPVEGWLKVMAFLMPMIFVWFLLRRGHSLKQRLFGFGWLALLILCVAITPTPPPA